MFSLSNDQKRKLLDLARRVVEKAARDGKRSSFPCEDESLSMLGAAFVTLHARGRLRGCIGHVEATMPLWDCVTDMAYAASTSDPRFMPVKPDEMDDLDLEISVLTPLEEVSDVESIEVGRHGLVMERGLNRGLLLPQVPTEQGWNREQFLGHTAMKAGLSPDAWRKKGTRLYSFEAIVFGEKELS